MNARRFSEFDIDALTEIINIAIGRAANTLGTLLHQRIMLSLIETHLLQGDDLRDFLHQAFDFTGSGVHMRFSGSMEGDGYLVLHKEDAVRLITMLLPHRPPVQHLGINEADVLQEVGNIILGSCLSTIGEQIGRRFILQAPAVRMNLSGEEIVHMLFGETGQTYLGLAFTSSLQIRAHTFTLPIIFIFKLEDEALQRMLQALGMR